MTKLEQARAIWEGMKQRDPEGCEAVEKSVKRRVAALKLSQIRT